MSKTKPLTIYSFGYWDWGTSTKQLVRLMDEAANARGDAPPYFVDIRFKRSGQAPEFVGKRFENLVGSERHLWEQRLGNAAIGTGRGITIADPAAAVDLLSLAVDLAKKNKPVVFFCACKWPALCHRHVVGGLILKAAKKEGRSVRVVEWPGGEPDAVSIKVSSEEYKKIAKGRKSITLTESRAKDLAGLPWCSIAQVETKGETPVTAIAAPPKYGKDGWYLPLPWNDITQGMSFEEICGNAWAAYRENGFEAREV